MPLMFSSIFEKSLVVIVSPKFGNIQNTNNQTQVGKVTTVAPTSMTQTSKASASCDKGSASIQKQSKLGGFNLENFLSSL
ncbi:hypothetical protein C2G38_2203697 [Gigaspora rosea]|uniref:Uncharacterized protein n=1 Tax=Gigaspora rosea TaxID=44941 RepID=A0A397UMF2_9GLOM|nr:hypothetical protein C2G38_2203697 [Gigaspora rosea]